MKPRCIALAGFVGVTTGFIAFAASADGYSGPPGAYIEKPYIGWTGFYIGGHVGGAWSTPPRIVVKLVEPRLRRRTNRYPRIWPGLGQEFRQRVEAPNSRSPKSFTHGRAQVDAVSMDTRGCVSKESTKPSKGRKRAPNPPDQEPGLGSRPTALGSICRLRCCTRFSNFAQVVVRTSDVEHRLFGDSFGQLFGDAASLLSAFVPIKRIIDVRVFHGS